MLAKKVETLTKAMEVEGKKMRREMSAMEKEVAAIRMEKDQDVKAKRLSINTKLPAQNTAQLPPARYNQLLLTSICTVLIRLAHRERNLF